MRMHGGSHDATDAKTAHYGKQQILRSGIIKSANAANVSVRDMAFISNISIAKLTLVTEKENQGIEISDAVKEAIENLRRSVETSNTGFGIMSASVAMLAGYILRTLEEKYSL